MAQTKRSTLQVENHGTIILLRPMTRAARRWLADNCAAEPWQWYGGALACEPRMAADIVRAYRRVAA